jgi:hypothetical protein
MSLPILEVHSQIIKVIPSIEKKLISDLSIFILTVSPTNCNKKLVYEKYLRILLKYMPQRILQNSDPQWMWSCQEIFSYSFSGLLI